MRRLLLLQIPALFFCILLHSSISAQPKKEMPASPRLSALQKEVETNKPAAVADFWQEVAKTGTPLVERIKGNDNNVLVTFLWRSKKKTNVVIMCDFGATVSGRVLTRLLTTDIWYRTYSMPGDSRFFYQFSVDDPNFPFEGGDETKYPGDGQHDVFNPRQYDFAKPAIFSIVELSSAPSMDLSKPNPSLAKGTLGGFAKPLESKILGNERKIFVYKPSGYSDTAKPYPLLIFGASYINQVRLPIILDNLIAQRLIPPVVAIFVGFPPSKAGQNIQDEESGGGRPFSDFIATELIPWVHQQVNVTTDPKKVIIGGASAGGNAAAFVAIHHPEAIGNVIAQSGAFWRGVGHDSRYWSAVGSDDGREGFARTVASFPAGTPILPVRFFLTIGRLENATAFNDGLISMIHASRHVRDVLQAKGYEVILRETSGGHDPYNWETSLPEGLTTLLNDAPKK